LVRSDGGGETFHYPALPQYIRATPSFEPFMSVDPTDQNVLYATGDELLYQSTDAGLTWHPILTNSIASALIRSSANCPPLTVPMRDSA
jgi:hypothetical protein